MPAGKKVTKKTSPKPPMSESKVEDKSFAPESVSEQPEKQTYVEKNSWDRKEFHNHSVNVFGALFMIGLGVIFLMNNFGVLPWSIWGVLWRFWPIFLIMGGLELILGKSWLSKIVIFFVGGFVLLFVFIASVFALGDSKIKTDLTKVLPKIIQDKLTALSGKSTTKTYVLQRIDFKDIKSRDINIDLPFGEMKIYDNDTSDLFNGVVQYTENSDTPVFTTSTNFNTLKINLKKETSSFWTWNFNKSSYDISLGAIDIPTSLNLSQSTGSTDVKLSNLLLTDLNIDQSTGSTKIDLSETSLPTGKIVVNLSTGNIVIKLPKATDLRVKYDISTGSTNVDGKTLTGSGMYESNSSEVNSKLVNIEVDLSTGSVQIQR